MSLDPDDAGHLTRDRHGPGTVSSSGHRTHAARTTTYYRDVLLGRVCAAFSVVEHLLRLAVLVHCNDHDFLLSITRQLARSVYSASASDFAGGGGANIEDGSSLIIHWSSGSQKDQRSKINWANQYDIYLVGAPTGGGPGAMAPWTTPLIRPWSALTSRNQLLLLLLLLHAPSAYTVENSNYY